MDGITTAASAFAVISVAGQLAVGVKKLHSFWNSLQDAPDDVQSLSKELKLFLTILGEIEESEQRYGPNAATTDVLESCNAQINSLTAITEELKRGFTTQSSSKRKWCALKAVFKRDTVKKFQDKLRVTKVTLLLAQQQNGFRSGHTLQIVRVAVNWLLMDRRTLNTLHDSQRDQLSTFINELRLQINASPLAIRTRSTQPSYESHAGAMQSEVSRMASTVPNPIFRGALEQGVGRALEEHPRRLPAHGGGSQPATSECQLNVASSLQCGEGTLTGQSHSVVKNLFGTFSIYSKVRQLATSNNEEEEGLDSDDFERTTSIRIHPARWLIRLGLNFGLQFAAQGGPQCWKHTLTSYRAVSDDAAIFSACCRGDLDSVTKLLTDGKASIWDTDSDGWTPLHFAADSCHAHLCRFLISKGADNTSPTNSAWCSPLMLAAESLTCTQNMQIDTLRLFLNEIDFSEEAGPGSDGWDALSAIVDMSKNHDLTLQWLLESFASEITMHFDAGEFHWTLCHALRTCDPHLQFVPSMLRLGNDHVGKVLDNNLELSDTLIHRSIIYRSHTASILMKGANPHLASYPWYPWDTSKRPKSPTSVAMLSSRMFGHWRESLHDSGVDLEDFVKRECESGSVVEEGWNEDTLLYLFQLDIEGARIRYYDESCDRCDRTSRNFGCVIVGRFVEVGWCLILEKRKKGYVGHVGKDKLSTPNTGPQNDDQQEEEDVEEEDVGEKKDVEEEEEEDVEEGKGIYCPCVQKYTFVCCECWKELQDPNHEHRDTSETSSSAADEELPDWEYSPFLLSI